MKQSITLLLTILCAGCAGPTKVGTEVRVDAHQRMDVMNANLAAQQAKQQFEVGQLDAAIETIDAAIDRFNENAEYHLIRGRILLELHQLDAALKSLETASRLSPESAEPHYFLGVLYQRWSEDDSAMAAYKLATLQDPSHPQYFMAVAETYVALGRFDEALQYLIESGKEFQHQPSVPALIGQIYLLQGDPKKAAKYLSDSRLLGNDGSEILTSLAMAEFDAAMYARCLMTLQRLEESSEELPPIYQRMRGKCLFATGRVQQARDICLVVTRATPEEAGAWLDLGYIAWHMGDYERLGRCGERLTQLESGRAEGALFQGISALHAGDDELAKATLGSVQSDNEIKGLDAVVASILAKRRETAAETAIRPNLVSEFAEGGSERHPEDGADVSHPLVGVSPQSEHTP